MRQRQIKKELERLDSIYKSNKAAYEAITKKDSPLGRLHFNRMETAREQMNNLKHKG
jgi:archaellum component FlaC